MTVAGCADWALGWCRQALGVVGIGEEVRCYWGPLGARKYKQDGP
jgi:hypothetical protein